MPDLVAVTRPNGKVYRPRKQPVGVIVHDRHEDPRWIYILRTHDIGRARAMANRMADSEGFHIDDDEVWKGWSRDGMLNGERVYVEDPIRGVPTVHFGLDV